MGTARRRAPRHFGRRAAAPYRARVDVSPAARRRARSAGRRGRGLRTRQARRRSCGNLRGSYGQGLARSRPGARDRRRTARGVAQARSDSSVPASHGRQCAGARALRPVRFRHRLRLLVSYPPRGAHMIDDDLYALAASLGRVALHRRVRIATAESCTGGLIAGALTAVAGSSDWFECGFVTCSNAAKARDLGVPEARIDRFGAVSAGVAKALAAALAQIEKQFGKGSIMKMGEAQVQGDLSVISTGSLGLDIALGVGGLPRGRVVEVYGPESSGKTTLALQVVAQVQKAGGTAAYIDAENALDPLYAGKLGVNVGEMLISQPDTGEQGLEIADMLVRSGGVDVIVIDSVAALVPKAEIEGEMGDQLPG